LDSEGCEGIFTATEVIICAESFKEFGGGTEFLSGLSEGEDECDAGPSFFLPYEVSGVLEGEFAAFCSQGF